jgi:hypothetical protein
MPVIIEIIVDKRVYSTTVVLSLVGECNDAPPAFVETHNGDNPFPFHIESIYRIIRQIERSGFNLRTDFNVGTGGLHFVGECSDNCRIAVYVRVADFGAEKVVGSAVPLYFGEQAGDLQ